MVVGDSRTIDFVASDPGCDRVLLVMVEERDWRPSGLLLPDLEAKLDTYLAYVEEGRLTQDFPDLLGKGVDFELRCSREPGSRELAFLHIVQERDLAPRGIRMYWKTIGEQVKHGV